MISSAPAELPPSLHASAIHRKQRFSRPKKAKPRQRGVL
jgi:hypothetical protein